MSQSPAMANVTARATRAVDAPPERVLEFLRDYRQARPRILTDNYTAYRVEQGGHGAGTVIGYHFNSGRRERDYRMSVEEDGGGLSERDQLSSFVNRWTVIPSGSGAEVAVAEDGGGLLERDQLSSFVNRWTVVPDGAGSQVTLEASWQGASGIGGFFERTFAPGGLGRIYGQMLDKLAAAVSG